MRYWRSARIHPLFGAVFADWQAMAEVWSALPDAPVVPDEPRRPRFAWRWRSRWPRFAWLWRIRDVVANTLPLR